MNSADQKNDTSAEKQIEIIVNGRRVIVDSHVLSFDQAVALAFPGSAPADTIYTVTYFRGRNGNGEGSLVPGVSVEIKKEMVFNVTATTRS